MQNNFQSNPPLLGDSSKDNYAYIGLGLAVFSMCAWLIPFCGCPISLAAIGVSYVGLPSTKRNLAQIGIGLGGLAFGLTLLNAVLGVALSAGG